MPIDPITGMAIANVGTALIGGVSELLRSGSSNRSARSSRADYEEQMGAIPLQDPMMVGLIGETRRRRRAFEAGTDPMTAYTQQQIGAQGAQTQANAVRAGSRGVSDLLRVQAGTNRGLAESGARASQQANGMFALEGELVGVMADRAYRRQMADARLAWNEYARAKEDSGRQFQAGLGMILGAGVEAAGGFGKGRRGGGKMGVNNSMSGSFDSFSPINSGYDYLPPSTNNYG